jgi:hypothetical protein
VVSKGRPGSRIRRVVAKRATHRDKDEVGDTRSLGNIERTLVREYWGRFLIELIQNARDAWLEANPGQRGGRLIIQLTTDPALVVANSGAPITEDIVLDSISKVGESTRQYGEGIGYKGIGFKAVLELSATPEIYSRDRSAEGWGVRVRYDPEEARTLVRKHSPDWDSLVRELVTSAHDEDGDDRIPILRFPLWVEQSPTWLDALDDRGHRLNTVVRLPYDARYSARLGLDRNGFISKVQSAFAEITDEMVLLISVFDEIVIDDQIAKTVTTIERRVGFEQTLLGQTRLNDVEIVRDGNVTSRWWIWEQSLPNFKRLEGDILVGVRVRAASDGRLLPVLPQTASDRGGGDCFHLFFPTRIKTHLPFLFHAYFEVDASRKGFAADKVELNRRLLEGLRSLAVQAVRHLTRITPGGEVAIEALPSLFAASDGVPDDPLAAEFRENLLTALDGTKYVPTHPAGRHELAAPRELLVDSRPPLPQLLPIAFPAAYLLGQLGKRYADGSIDVAGLQFLEERSSQDGDGGLSSDVLRTLLRPGGGTIWSDDPDLGFRSLLQVLTFLSAVDPSVESILEDLAEADDAAIIPVIAAGGGRKMRPPPRLSRGSDSPRGQILARIRATAEPALAPPNGLLIDFLADGVVDNAMLSGAAQSLGIRAYTTDGVLDALLATAADDAEPDELLRFVWSLLLREAQSDLGLRAALGRAAGFDPGSFWWLASSGKFLSDSERVVQRRVRALTGCLLPTGDGTPRPAGQVVFGYAWADWLASQATGVGRERAAAYRELEAAAPGPDAVVAGPEELAAMLPFDEREAGWLLAADAPVLPDGRDGHFTLLHALLLRLGVWEIPPIESTVALTDRPEEGRDPWGALPLRGEQERSLREGPGRAFYSRHDNVHVGEDSRFAWPLRADPALIASLNRGVPFYRRHLDTLRFCPRCRGHSTRKLSTDDGALPSMLRWELGNLPWVPAQRQGSPVPPVLAREAWYERDLPDPTRLLQSWPRYLQLADAIVSPPLAELAGIAGMDNASAPRIARLLQSLRTEFDDRDIAPERRSTSSAGQAITSLHRRAYQRLAELDGDDAASIAAKVEVLAVKGRSLVFASPTDARHDDGLQAAQKRFFVGLVPFVTLDRENVRAAEALGVPRFRLSVERMPGGREEDVTDQIRPIIHDRAAEFLALQVYYPLTGQTLQLDSRAFSERATRLRSLRVVRVDDLRMELRLVDGDAHVEIGGEREGDAYLDLSASPPTLYHDLAGEGWEGRFRSLAGGQVAILLENPAYANTFSLLLQQESEAQREAFFSELNIAEEDLELVIRNLGAASGAIEAAERRWWNALLPMLGADAVVETDPDTYREAVRARLAELGVVGADDSLGVILLRAGGGEAVRRDTSPDSALAALERNQVDLAALDASLKAAGDAGLDISVARVLLQDWRSRHGDEVAIVLTRKSWQLDSATAAVGGWQAPEEAAHRIAMPPALYLKPVVETLADAGLSADAERLVGADVSSYLAELVGESAASLSQEWNALANDDAKERLLRLHAQAWRRILIPVIVASRTQPGELPFQIRAEVAVADQALPASPHTSVELLPALSDLLGPSPLFDDLEELIRAPRALAAPQTEAVHARVARFLDDPAHLTFVISVLRRGSRQAVDQVRREINEVRELDLAPSPVAGIVAPPGSGKRVSGKPRNVGGRRRRDQGHLDTLGLDAERWVRAATLNTLLSMDADGFAAAVRSMEGLLREVAQGPIVDSLTRLAEEAVHSPDDDDRLESLTAFVHVAQVSDDFGFDVLGFVAPYADAKSRPMLLEVKNSADRSFHVSTGEWDLAQERPDDYAFCIVVRSSTGQPPLGIEIIPDPSRQLAEGRLARREDGWEVSYGLAST